MYQKLLKGKFKEDEVKINEVLKDNQKVIIGILVILLIGIFLKIIFNRISNFDYIY